LSLFGPQATSGERKHLTENRDEEENSQESNSFNATNLFNQEDENKSKNDISSSKLKDKSNSLIKPQIFSNANISIMNNESNKNNSSNEPYNDLYQEEQKTFISANVYTKSKEEKSENDSSFSKPKDKSNSLLKPKNNPNISFSFMNKDISLLSIKEEKDQPSNELKNPYLKKDNIPEIEFIGKNNIIICDKKKYEITLYRRTK